MQRPRSGNHVVLESYGRKREVSAYSFFSFRGYLKADGLTWKVTLTGFTANWWVSFGFTCDSQENTRRLSADRKLTVTLLKQNGEKTTIKHSGQLKGSNRYDITIANFCFVDALAAVATTDGSPPEYRHRIKLLIDLQRASSKLALPPPAPVPVVTTADTQPPKRPRDMRSVTMSLLESSTLHDVKLKVGDKEFNAHMCILAAQSDVFKSMFELDMTEKNQRTVKIDDLSPETVDTLLKYMYGHDLDSVCKDAQLTINLLQAADKYYLMDLTKSCELLFQGFSPDKVDLKTALEAFLLGHRLSIPTLENHAVTVLRRKRSELAESDCFEDFLEAHPDISRKLFVIMTSP